MTQEQKRLVERIKAATANILKIADETEDSELEENAKLVWDDLDALEAEDKTTVEQTKHPEYGMCVKCKGPVRHVNGTKHWPERCPQCLREIEASI